MWINKYWMNWKKFYTNDYVFFFKYCCIIIGSAKCPMAIPSANRFESIYLLMGLVVYI